MSNVTARAQTREVGSQARFTVPKRREHGRYQVELDVSLGGVRNLYVGLSENLSAGGVFIATHQLEPVGERLELSVFLPDGGPAVKCVGEVRWVREYNERSDMPPGMGIRFVELGSQDCAAIARFIEDRDPMPLEHED